MADHTVDAITGDDALPVGSVGRHASGWWGMWCVITTEAALFAYLLFSYAYLALFGATPWPPGGPPRLTLAGSNTLVLIASSLAVWWGERGIARGDRWRLVAGLGTGLALGAVFVGLQLVEWSGKPFGFSSPYGGVYFTITGFHLTHVAVGLITLGALTGWGALGRFGPVRHAAVSVGALYWHFVDVVWLFVFATLYLSPHLGSRHVG